MILDKGSEAQQKIIMTPGQEKYLVKLQHIAKKHGGKCLSLTYRNTKTKLEWICNKKHQWWAKPDSIFYGTWCPICARENRRVKINTFHRIAAQKGGICHSNDFLGWKSPLEFECENKHIWSTSARNIKSGTWCPICAKNKNKLTLEEMHALAAQWEGKCLSTDYINSSTKLRWRCKYNHEWEAKPSHIKGGTWCYVCNSIFLRRYSIIDLRKFAETLGGTCLSLSYSDAYTPLTWQCDLGHIWEENAWNTLHGYWCHECAQNNEIPRNVFFSKSIVDMQVLANRQGGYCLSLVYLGTSTDLIWKCQKGHIWNTPPHEIQRGSWCPICAQENRKLSLEDLNHIAAQRGGSCLSTSYRNNKSLLQWKCGKEHVWIASAQRIKRGSWCRICAQEARKTPLEKYQHIAAQKGGVCLSSKYINNRTPLLWKCARGHKWTTQPSNIKAGSWCPYCANDKLRDSLDKFYQIASQKGGKCRSLIYVNKHTLLEFECANHHIWKTEAQNINLGHWCPYCANEMKKKH